MRNAEAELQTSKAKATAATNRFGNNDGGLQLEH